MPFEKQLCEDLGITEDEYQEFLAEMMDRQARHPVSGEYPVNGPVVGLITAIVGVLFQVVGLLLRPKPRGAQGQSREESPRGEQASPVFGFNSVQDVARIGTVVPQVYCDRSFNPAGGCRVNTQLVWSQVESYGNAQLAKFLTVLSDNQIREIDPNSTAVGQTLLRSASLNSFWQYFAPRNGFSGRFLQQNATAFRQLVVPNNPDPSGDAPYRVPQGNSRVAGTCQAYSPTTGASFGFTQIIPIANRLVNYRVADNNEEEVEEDWNRIRIDATTANRIRTGSFTQSDINNYIMTISFEQIEVSNRPVGEKNNQFRNNIVQSLDPAGKYIFGRTVWQFIPFSPGENANIETGQVNARFRLIEGTGGGGILASEQQNILEAEVANIASAPQVDRRHLALSEFANYVTVSKCNAVEFSIKAQVWAELQSPFRDDTKINGDRIRAAFFSARYRRAGTTAFTDVPRLFFIKRSSKTEVFFFIRFEFPSLDSWEVEFNPVIDWAINSPNIYYQIDPRGGLAIDQPSGSPARFCFNGRVLLTASADNFKSSLTKGKWQEDSTYRAFQDARWSWQQGPEFQIIAANEIQYDSRQDSYYQDLSMLGVNFYGGRGRQDAAQVSAFVNRGRILNRFDNGNISGTDASNRFGDIFVDTLTSARAGLGQFISLDMIDLQSVSRANRFTERNRLYFEGVIDGEVEWREWATENAGYSLLQLATRNGRFALEPVVPTDSQGNISPTGYTVKALFNESNILEGSYTEALSDAEATLPRVITVRYRENQFTAAGAAGFPRERSVSWRLQNEGTDDEQETVINAAGSVTTEEQADFIAIYLLLAARYEDRTVQFKTPDPWIGLAPGDIIRVDTQFVNFSANFAGRVLSDGTVDLYGFSGDATASGVALVYTPGSGSVQTINYSGGTLPSFAGSLIAVGQNNAESRLWTITKIDIDDDGLAEISAKLFPTLPGNPRPSLVATAIQPQNRSSYVTRIRTGG